MRPRHPHTRRADLAAAVAAGALLLAVSASRANAYDFSQGQYLSAEEYAKLSKDEATAYCQQLAQEIDIQNDNAAAASSQTTGLDAQIADLRARLAGTKSANEQQAAEILELESKANPVKQVTQPPPSDAHVVVEGEWLMRIAGEVYGDKSQWKRIWEANRAGIPNPDLIYPGHSLVIPH